MKYLCSLFILILAVVQSCHQESKLEHFDYRVNRFVVFKGTIQDTCSARFIFDTGGYGLLLDSEYVKEKKIIFIDTLDKTIVGNGNKGQDWKTTSESLNITLLGKQYQKEPVTGGVRSVFGNDVDGMIGWDFFEKDALFINFINHSTSRVKEPEDSLNSDYFKIPLTKKENLLTIPLELSISGKTIRGNFLVDLGYSGSVMLTNLTAKLNNINPLSLNHVYYETSGLSGKSTGYDCRVNNIKIKNLTISDPIIEISSDTLGFLAGHPYFDGLIGNALLDRFNIILDFKNLQLYLKPRFTLNFKFHSVRKRKYL